MPSKELVAASTKPLLLALLRVGESYGYELIERVRHLSDGTLEWSDGMLYPVLRRLEREGLVASRWSVAENGRRRRYYRLTAKGEKGRGRRCARSGRGSIAPSGLRGAARCR